MLDKNILGPQIENINYAGKAELNILNLAETEEIDEKSEEILEKSEYEAKFVAKRVKELFNSSYYIFDKKIGYRKLEYKDIVILLRAPNNVAENYEKELVQLGYPVFCDISANYFETIEIQIILSLLKIIDNPYNDIAMVSVLRSPIVGLTDNELVQIRLCDTNKSFYNAVLKAKELPKPNKKLADFLIQLEDFKEKKDYFKLDELIWYIYKETGYYNYIMLTNNGNIKIANLKMLFEKAKEYENGSFKGLYNFISFIDRVSKTGSDMGAPKLIGENENVIRIMSIHKSKGLEFPVVFLCGTGKQFNVQDLNEKILIDENLGFGPKYINYKRKIGYDTFAKIALKIKEKEEIMAEEMRLLYVALTRSREKLIITGTDRNLEKSLKDKQEFLENNINNNKISKAVIKKCKSYLDWLEIVTLFNKDINEYMDIKYNNKENFISEEIAEQDKIQILPSKDVSQEIRKALEWKYNKIDATKLAGKTSVSKIAKKNETDIKITAKPQFLSDVDKLTGAEVGTVIHLILQKLNFRENYTKEKIRELMQNLVNSEIITPNAVNSIEVEKILQFTNSELFKMVSQAKEIYKEAPFYINLPASEVYDTDSDESVLIQGIIDLYFVNQKGEKILVDYKTDKETNEEILKERYAKQISLYKRVINPVHSYIGNWNSNMFNFFEV